LAGRKQESVTIEVLLLDMTSYDSIRALVEALKTEQRLDIVILNAGVSNEKLRVVPETGSEEIIQVNYISMVLLTILLLPLLKEKQVTGKPNRLVVVSSDTAAWSKAKSTAPILSSFKKPTKFDRATQYDASKLFGQLFITELTKRIPSNTITIVLANPGLCSKTGLSGQRSTAEGFAFYLICSALGHSAAVGAVSLTGAAVQHGQEAHGCYIENNKIAP
jgi:NAD(P)-dependent dehydrogenase (short-subunit alcohol dehydrogenase family)